MELNTNKVIVTNQYFTVNIIADNTNSAWTTTFGYFQTKQIQTVIETCNSYLNTRYELLGNCRDEGTHNYLNNSKWTGSDYFAVSHE